MRPATAVFVLLGGIDHDANASAVLDMLVATAQHTMRRHGGVLLELTIGDKGCCLCCSFGAAQVHEDDPARALGAALGLRRPRAARRKAPRRPSATTTTWSPPCPTRCA